MDRTWEIEIEGHGLVAVLTHASESDIPVFFLHGIGGSIYFWTPELTSPFHDIGPCYSLSLPGHFPAAFPNDFPADCLTAELIARLVSNAIQEIAGNKKALLVGHSTGGFAALSAAIYDPRIVAGIVMSPVLCMVFDAAGIYGTWFIAIVVEGLSPGTFMKTGSPAPTAMKMASNCSRSSARV